MAVAVADPAPGQVKDEKPARGFDQFVTIEGKGKDGAAFTVEKVSARRATSKMPQWVLDNNKVGPTAGRPPYSEVVITDKGGKAFKITSVRADGSQLWCPIDEPAAP